MYSFWKSEYFFTICTQHGVFSIHVSLSGCCVSSIWWPLWIIMLSMHFAKISLWFCFLFLKTSVQKCFFQSHIAVLVLVVWRFFTLVSTALILFHVCTQGSRLPTPLDSHILVFLMRESWLVTYSFALYFYNYLWCQNIFLAIFGLPLKK